MPWDNSPEARRQSALTYGGPEYQRNRRACLMQAGCRLDGRGRLIPYGRCEGCGRTTHVECDHIINVKSSDGEPDHSLNNLQALCKSCHGKKTAEESNREPGTAAPDPQPTPRTQW